MMRFILLLLLPISSFAQGKLIKISLFDGKIELMAPKKLSEMSDEMWALKYRSRERPPMVLTDADGEVNLLVSTTNQPAQESQMEDFINFQLGQLKQQRSDLIMLDHGVRTVNGKNLGYIKFLSQAIDQKVFNYHFFIIVDGKIVFFSFNCIDRLKGDWEPVADEIAASIQVK